HCVWAAARFGNGCGRGTGYRRVPADSNSVATVFCHRGCSGDAVSQADDQHAGLCVVLIGVEFYFRGAVSYGVAKKCRSAVVAGVPTADGISTNSHAEDRRNPEFEWAWLPAVLDERTDHWFDRVVRGRSDLQSPPNRIFAATRFAAAS